MDQSMYSALFGAMSNEFRVNVTANNLANVNTTAFKRDQVAFHDTFVKFAHDYVVDTKPFIRDKPMWPDAHVMAKARLSDQYTDMKQGGIQKTGNQLDFALQGQGFFKVMVGGEVQYTRAGSFTIDSSGTLMTPQGYPVQVGGGPVSIPPGAQIKVDDQGRIVADGQVLGTLDLADISDPRAVEKVGDNLYRIKAGSNATEVEPENLTVAQGYLEKSNVEVVTEMVTMIEAQRAFQIYQKMISGTDQMNKQMINKVGRPG